MATCFMPFVRANKGDLYYRKILKGEWEELWSFYEKGDGTSINFSDSFKDLIEQMLDPVPLNRPNFNQIKLHPWFSGVTATADELFFEMERRKGLIEVGSTYDTNSMDVSMSDEGD